MSTLNTDNSLPELAIWRRTVAEMYAAVRAAPPAAQPVAWQDWRARRNRLFKEHPQSPLTPAQRRRFQGLPYNPYDSAWRLTGRIWRDVPAQTFRIDLDQDGDFQFKRIGRVIFASEAGEASLNLYWIEGYGGGLFLPFLDLTNGKSTFGGGRYLYDTLKGADLGLAADSLVLDFNYAYNPSCAYHPRWTCPLSPLENRLPFAVNAGERAFAESM